jgi:hypothetical protein
MTAIHELEDFDFDSMSAIHDSYRVMIRNGPSYETRTTDVG